MNQGGDVVLDHPSQGDSARRLSAASPIQGRHPAFPRRLECELPSVRLGENRGPHPCNCQAESYFRTDALAAWLEGHAEPSQFLGSQFFDTHQVLEHSLADPPQLLELLNVELVEQVRAHTLHVHRGGSLERGEALVGEDGKGSPAVRLDRPRAGSSRATPAGRWSGTVGCATTGTSPPGRSSSAAARGPPLGGPGPRSSGWEPPSAGRAPVPADPTAAWWPSRTSARSAARPRSTTGSRPYPQPTGSLASWLTFQSNPVVSSFNS